MASETRPIKEGGSFAPEGSITQPDAPDTQTTMEKDELPPPTTESEHEGDITAPDEVPSS